MKIIKPLDWIPLGKKSVFLAGSIEMGAAEDWQSKVERLLEDTDWIVFNPRRDDWDSSWEQKITNTEFCNQVIWELKAMEAAEKIIVYFSPGTKSPITLLEFGLIVGQSPEKLIVVCPDGFWKKGNIDIVCDRYSINQVATLEKAVENLKRGSR